MKLNLSEEIIAGKFENDSIKNCKKLLTLLMFVISDKNNVN